MATTETHRMELADANALAAFYEAQTSTETALVQLGRGKSALDGESLDLGPIRLLRVTAEGHHLWTDRMDGTEWRFAVLTEADNGATLDRTSVSHMTGTLLRPGDEIILNVRGRYRTLEITFDAALAHAMGWDWGPGVARELPEAHLHGLARTVGSAFKAMAHPTVAREDPQSALLAERWSGRILDQLASALGAWQNAGDTASEDRPARVDRCVVAQAESLLRDPDYARSATVEMLATDLGMARRTLFLAFRRELGIGPRRFGEIVRLNQLRARLYRTAPDATTVTAEASDLGFHELGRMAGRYRQLFGETPRDTLRHN